MSESGFSSKSTETLLKTRENLLSGLTRVSETLDDGSFNVLKPKGGASPAIAGSMILSLLLAVQEVLTERGHPLTW